MQLHHMLYIFAIVSLSSCAAAPEEATTDSAGVADTAIMTNSEQTVTDTSGTSGAATTDTLRPQVGHYSPECYSTITDIVQSSSFKTDQAKKENIKIRIDRQENSKLFIQLFASEKENESTIGWLRLDKATEELEDITIDPDKPVKLTYDTSLISALRQHCP